MKEVILLAIVLSLTVGIIATASADGLFRVSTDFCDMISVEFYSYPLRPNNTVVIYIDGEFALSYVSPGERLRRAFSFEIDAGEHLVSVSIYYVPGEPVGRLIFFDYVTVTACTSATPTSPHIPPFPVPEERPYPRPWGSIN